MSSENRSGGASVTRLAAPGLSGPAAAGTRKSSLNRKSGAPQPEKSTVLPARAPRKRGDEFGAEGTNKTIATPKSDNVSADELGLGPHVEKTPYTRG
jgi:hypothetical protein